MSTYRIERHEELGTPTTPTQAAVDAGRVWEMADVAMLGHADFAYTAAELAECSMRRGRSCSATAQGNRAIR